jgi:DNA-binding NarL/FixJ family response regulator
MKLTFPAGPFTNNRRLLAARGVVEGREVLVLSYGCEPAVRLSALSPAERAVVQAILRGRKNAEIARERGTSALTVAKQVASALRKLGVRTRGELASLASGGQVTQLQPRAAA